MTEVSEALAETGSSVDGGDVGIVDYAASTPEHANMDQSSSSAMEQRLAQLENTMHRLSSTFQD